MHRTSAAPNWRKSVESGPSSCFQRPSLSTPISESFQDHNLTSATFSYFNYSDMLQHILSSRSTKPRRSGRTFYQKYSQ
ncbi:hypothetical protein GYH30_033907 [Glycine max]|nr:hypothetical protein GYH30_033907 [Glycine max]